MVKHLSPDFGHQRFSLPGELLGGFSFWPIDASKCADGLFFGGRRSSRPHDTLLHQPLKSVPGNFLTEVLAQSEHIQKLIEQSAAEAGNGIDVNEAVKKQLLDASNKLTTVIQSLRIEIRDRNMVDHELAAALEQGEASRNAALHDNLTGLPNRVLFTDRLQHGIAQAKRHQQMLAVMFVDLDNFKTINDTYGHQAGDAILQTVATRLRQNTRDADTVSRYGGDEFLYLLNQVREESHIATIAAKILKAIQAPCNVNAADVIANPCLKASIGISVFPRHGTTASALIRSADAAMFAAKKGNSGYAFAP
jgi:diguanylate cyclase (GGDEF)-like protein